MATLKSIERARGFVHIRDPDLSDLDHGELGGLDQDDHPQYFNEMRGDARYYTQAQVDTSLAAQNELSELTDTSISGTQTTGDTLYWNGTDWTDTGAITVDPTAAVELNHAGNRTLETHVQGINIFSSNDETPILDIHGAGGTAYLRIARSNTFQRNLVQGLSPGEPIFLQARNAADTSNRRLLTGDPDGSVDLYYDGTLRSRTDNLGHDVIPNVASGFNWGGYFTRDNTDSFDAMRLYFNGVSDTVYLDNTVHGGGIQLRAENTGGALRTGLIFDPDGPVNLFHAGTKVFETTSNGAAVLGELTVAVSAFASTEFKVADGIEGGVNITSGESTSPKGLRFRVGNPDLGSTINNTSIRIQHTAGRSFQHQWITLHYGGGVTIGNPSGGDQGQETINARGVYDDGTLLTDYVFDAELDGDIDTEKWDRAVPNRVRREEDEEGRTIREEVEERIHAPARRFIERMDDLDPEAYAAKWRTRRKLPAFDEGDEPVKLSVGDWAQRLLETCEVQAVHIDKLRQRIVALEERLNGTDTAR